MLKRNLKKTFFKKLIARNCTNAVFWGSPEFSHPHSIFLYEFPTTAFGPFENMPPKPKTKAASESSVLFERVSTRAAAANAAPSPRDREDDDGDLFFRVVSFLVPSSSSKGHQLKDHGPPVIV